MPSQPSPEATRVVLESEIAEANELLQGQRRTSIALKGHAIALAVLGVILVVDVFVSGSPDWTFLAFVVLAGTNAIRLSRKSRSRARELSDSIASNASALSEAPLDTPLDA